MSEEVDRCPTSRQTVGRPNPGEAARPLFSNYLGFRTKTYYDGLYRPIETETFKPDADAERTLTHSEAHDVRVGHTRTSYDVMSGKPWEQPRYTHHDDAGEHRVIVRTSYDKLGRVVRVEQRNTDSSYEGGGTFDVVADSEYRDEESAVVSRAYLKSPTGAPEYLQSKVENDWLGRGVSRLSYDRVKEFDVKRMHWGLLPLALSLVVLAGCDVLDGITGQLPDTPSGLTAADNGDETILITWNASEEADQYLLEVSNDGSTFTQGYYGTETAVLHTDVVPQATYYYRVAAENDEGFSDYSQVVSGSAQSVQTYITVYNNTSYDLYDVSWTGGDDVAWSFSSEEVWSEAEFAFVYGLPAGGAYERRPVAPGSNYLYFAFAESGDHYRTDEIITVAAGGDVEFTITDGTAVWSADVAGPALRLGDLLNTP